MSCVPLKTSSKSHSSAAAAVEEIASAFCGWSVCLVDFCPILGSSGKDCGVVTAGQSKIVNSWPQTWEHCQAVASGVAVCCLHKLSHGNENYSLTLLFGQLLFTVCFFPFSFPLFCRGLA